MKQISHEQTERIRIGDKVTITPRGRRGIWTAEFNREGRHCHRSLKTTNVRIARQRATLIEAELATGQYAAPVKPLAIDAAIKQFMQSRRSEGRAKKTLVKYQFELDRFEQFLSTRRAISLLQITPTLFDAYRDHRKENLSDKTVYNSVLIIKTFVRWCVNRELLERDPLRSCRLIEPYVPPKRTPTTEQVRKILGAAQGDRRVQIAMLAYAGVRAGELQMLRPLDVDINGGWIHIRAHGNWVPKTRKARTIPLHPKLLKYLETTSHDNQPYFFQAQASPGYPLGDHHIDLRSLNEGFQQLAKCLGMPVGRKHDGYVLHSLRHYFETTCVDSGIPQFVVDAWMGHTGAALMGKTYYGIDSKKSRAYMKQVQF